MTYLIDRRVQGKNKSAVNRDRFLRRYRGQVKAAVERAVKGLDPGQGHWRARLWARPRRCVGNG